MSNVFYSKKRINLCAKHLIQDGCYPSQNLRPQNNTFRLLHVERTLYAACIYLFNRVSILSGKMTLIARAGIVFMLLFIYLFMLLFIKASKKNILAALAVLVKQKKKLSRQHIRQPQYHNIKVERRLRLSSDGDLKVPLTPNCFKPLKPKLESYVTTVLIRRLLRLICYLGNVRFYQYHVKRSFSCMHLKSNFSETG